MMENRPIILIGGAAVLAIIVAIVMVLVKFDPGRAGDQLSYGTKKAIGESSQGKARGSVERPRKAEEDGGLPPGLAFATAAMRALLEEMLGSPKAIRNEAVLRFKDDKAFEDFLARARAEGVEILSKIDSLRAVRLRFSDGESLLSELARLDADSVSLEPNYLYSVPVFSDPVGGGVQEGAVPFGYRLFERLGIDVNNAEWGEGVTVAIIDSGILDHSTFRDGQVKAINVNGEPGAVVEDGISGHGTAVASLVAGNSRAALGLAPGADLLDIRVLNDAGMTSSFQIAEALSLAHQNGADIANLSLGSTADSGILRDLIDELTGYGMVIVAAAGNDGGEGVLYPAAYDPVVAVGAVDATGQRLAFSNSGEGIDVAAPGLALPAAGTEDNAVTFTGTSSAAPTVAGAIGAVMSIYGLPADQAVGVVLGATVEAGAPGADLEYGAGNLNFQSITNADDPGYTNLAVAGNHVEGDTLFVTVENRGNVPVYNGWLDVSFGASGSERTSFSALDAGETATYEFYLNPAYADEEGRATIISESGFAGTPGSGDSTDFDNVLTSTVDVSGDGS